MENPTPFPRMTWHDAMNRYGIDQPDTRFAMELSDVSDVFRDSQFKVFRSVLDGGGVIKAINAKGAAALLSRSSSRNGRNGRSGVRRERTRLHQVGASAANGKSPIVKFFSDVEKAALAERMGFAEGDVLFFGADKWEHVCEVLGRVRLRCAELLRTHQGQRRAQPSVGRRFPLLAFMHEENAGGRRAPSIHTPARRGRAAVEAGDYGKSAPSPTTVLNGVELGGGSIRIHERDLQAKMFEVLGVGRGRNTSSATCSARSASARRRHGGIALGLDRLVMLIVGAGRSAT